MDFDFEELYQAVILDHSRKPRNFGPLPDATVTVSGDNPTCGDEIALSLKIDRRRPARKGRLHRRGLFDLHRVHLVDDHEDQRAKRAPRPSNCWTPFNP